LKKKLFSIYQLLLDPQNVELLSSRPSLPETWDAITQQEEQDLTNLMSEYDFAIKDAERFVDMLQQRLTDLDVVMKNELVFNHFTNLFFFFLRQTLKQ